MSAELEQKFYHHHIPSVIAMEQTLLKAANGSDLTDEIATLGDTCFKNDTGLSGQIKKTTLTPSTRYN